jgi:hypothetical protein
MLRILGFILLFYVVGLSFVDNVWNGGRYSRAVLQELNYRVYRVSVEVRYQLDKMAHATNFAVPSRADDRR